MKILTKQISKVLEENQPPEQGGFRSKFSTADHLQIINQILERTEQLSIILYMAFVEYKKAFDCIEHKSVLEAPEETGIEHKYIRIVGKIYRTVSRR